MIKTDSMIKAGKSRHSDAARNGDKIINKESAPSSTAIAFCSTKKG